MESWPSSTCPGRVTGRDGRVTSVLPGRRGPPRQRSPYERVAPPPPQEAINQRFPEESKEDTFRVSGANCGGERMVGPRFGAWEVFGPSDEDGGLRPQHAKWRAMLTNIGLAVVARLDGSRYGTPGHRGPRKSERSGFRGKVPESGKSKNRGLQTCDIAGLPTTSLAAASSSRCASWTRFFLASQPNPEVSPSPRPFAEFAVTTVTARREAV